MASSKTGGGEHATQRNATRTSVNEYHGGGEILDAIVWLEAGSIICCDDALMFRGNHLRRFVVVKKRCPLTTNRFQRDEEHRPGEPACSQRHGKGFAFPPWMLFDGSLRPEGRPRGPRTGSALFTVPHQYE